jgi:hypothetical protein
MHHDYDSGWWMCLEASKLMAFSSAIFLKTSFNNYDVTTYLVHHKNTLIIQTPCLIIDDYIYLIARRRRHSIEAEAMISLESASHMEKSVASLHLMMMMTMMVLQTICKQREC